MKKAVFIDLRNAAQINWFNGRGQKLAKWVLKYTIVESETNKPVGYLLMPVGLFARKALKEAVNFMEKTVTVDSNWLNQFMGS